VQVDPFKPTLKAPETERLKLKCEELLSDYAFKFNLRRYTVDTGKCVAAVGRCRLPVSEPE
jgi:hypothetical protein